MQLSASMKCNLYLDVHSFQLELCRLHGKNTFPSRCNFTVQMLKNRIKSVISVQKLIDQNVTRICFQTF